MRILLPFLILFVFACKNDKQSDTANQDTTADTTAFKYEFRDTTLVSIYARDFLAVIRSKPNMPILDVRTEAEFDRGHIWRAVCFDVSDPIYRTRLAGFGKDQEYALYCKSGQISFKVAEEMKRMGFLRIYHLRNGLNDWGQTGQALQITR